MFLHNYLNISNYGSKQFEYGYDNIKKKCGDVEIKPIFDLRNFQENL